jgi:hypothetical protein
MKYRGMSWRASARHSPIPRPVGTLARLGRGGLAQPGFRVRRGVTVCLGGGRERLGHMRTAGLWFDVN